MYLTFGACTVGKASRLRLSFSVTYQCARIDVSLNLHVRVLACVTKEGLV